MEYILHLLFLCSSMTLGSEGKLHFPSFNLCIDSDATVRGSTSNPTIRYTSPSGLAGAKLLWTECNGLHQQRAWQCMNGTSWSDTGWRQCAYRLTRWNLMIMVRWLLMKAFWWCMNPTLNPSSYCRSPVFKFLKTVAAGKLSASLAGRQKVTHTSKRFSFPSD